MNKIHLLIILFLICLGQSAQAQYYSVNYDKKTVAAMAAAYNTEAATEAYYNEQVQNILKHYNAAEVATAGIFASKFLDRKALTELGVWSSSTENYYYRRIYNMVSRKIMPKIWTVAGMMLKSPQTALYWGSYLVKICDDTKSLCMQFESVVTNSSLTFSDIAFLQIKDEIASILKLSEIGNVDWQRMLDDLSKVPGNFTVDNLKADIDNLYKTGVNLASAGVSNIGDAFLQSSQFHDLINGKLGAAVNIVDNYSALFEQLDKSVGNTLLGMVGGKDNVAGLFNFANYNLTSWMTDYMSETAGNYYTQRWYIARRDQGSETLCDYYPPTDDNSIIYGGEWTRFSTSDPNFSPSSAQQEQILSNSERCAGWSRSRVDMLNKQNDGFNYYINYYLYSYIISRGGRQTQKSYAYEIHVTKNWNRVEEVYEEVFDSYSMDLNTFKAQLNARLSEFNDNEEGYTYYIGSDSRNYYQATDAGKLKGCESVTISVTCSDGVSLGSGSTQYKCRECSGSLNAHSKECGFASPRDTSLDKATDVYWFESAFDAMAYYQLTKEHIKESIHGYEQMQSEGSNSGDAEMRELEDELKELNKAVFVSTGGNPSLGQMRGMIDATHQANHHLGFDRDEAGQTFAISFAMTKADRIFNSHIGTNGNLVVVDTTDGYKRTEIDMKDFCFPKEMEALGIGHIMRYNEMAIYLKSLKDPQNIFSGDCDLLPYPVSSAYSNYESSCEELYSSKQSGLVCKEELDELRQETVENADAYHVALKKAFEEYKRQGGQTTYNPCEQCYKDWNDQLLDKRQYSQTDQVETAFDDNGNDVVVEREEEYEENREQDEAGKKQYRFHR